MSVNISQTVVLAFVLVSAAALLWARNREIIAGTDFLKYTGTFVLCGLIVFLAVGVYDQSKVAPAYAILGAAVGYIWGKTETPVKPSASDSTNVQTTPKS